MRALLRRPEAALLATVLAAYAWFYQAGGWNQNSRFALSRALAEHGTAVVDRYRGTSWDLSCMADGGGRSAAPHKGLRPGEHFYCDKAPGASVLAVPVVAAAELFGGSDRPSPRWLAATSYLATLWAVGLPSAIAVVMLALLLGALGVGTRERLAIALAYGLATLAFPYATLFYGHQLAAALLLSGFALLVRQRRASTSLSANGELSLAGFLLGAAIAVEYPAALAALPIGAYALTFVRPWKRTGWLIAGGAVPVIALAAYHWIVFGGPGVLPYDYSVQGNRSQGFFMGLGAPHGEALWQILVGRFRGLFFSAPWLLLSLPGLVILWRRPALRAEAAVCTAVALLFLWLNASLVDWSGGWALGPRYLIPAIPFLAIGAAGVALAQGRAWRIVRAAGLAAAALSFLLMLAGTAVKPEVQDQRTVHGHAERIHPFGDVVWPHLADGELAINAQRIDQVAPGRERAAWNLGQLAGLPGLWSLLPLALLLAGGGAWMWRTTRPGGV
ncbi:MAG TPA: hypothetical protein VL172_17335 [Kofleriaceae bacterium]|nr:hypothetical protein [Kofleriaceae bacterium]